MVGYHLGNVVFAFVGFDSEIVQLAVKRDNGEFNRYILPKKHIHPKASEVTGTGDKLYYKGQQLVTYPKDDLKNFIQ